MADVQQRVDGSRLQAEGSRVTLLRMTANAHWHVCATPALARQLRQGFALEQRDAGKRVWAAPLIADLESFIAQCWTATWPSERLLSPAQHLAVWQGIVEADPDTESLIARRGLARLAMQAARLVARYQIDLPASPAWTPEHAAFQRWHAHYLETLAGKRWLSSADLPRAATARLDDPGALRPQRLSLHGFVEPPDPACQAFLDALAARGTQVDHIDNTEQSSGTSAWTLADDATQWAWLGDAVAQQLLVAAEQDQPAPDIVIACADPAQHAAHIAGEFAPRVAPWAVDARSGQRAQPWRVEPAPALAEAPLAAAAVAIVGVGSWRNEFAAVSRVLLCGALWQGRERLAAAELEAALRRYAQPLVHLSDCVRHAPEPLRVRMQAWERVVRDRPPRATPGEWAAHFQACLDAVAWPGQVAQGSAAFQAARVVRESLAQLAGLDNHLGHIGHAAATSWLGELLRGRPWAARADHAQTVTITTHAEAAALRADVRYVLDVDDGHWPRAPLRQGLLPIASLRAAGVPGADADQTLQAAKTLARALQAGAPAVQLLLSRVDDSGSTRLPARVWPDDLQWIEAALSAASAASAPLSELVEDAAPPVENAQAEGVRGGTRIFASFAASPLLAFAAHRLGIEPLEPLRNGLSMREQGIVVHDVLDAYWAQTRDHATHAARSAAELRRVVDGALAKSLDEQIDAHRFAQALLRSEHARLLDVLLRWLRLEATRPEAFTVAAREKTINIDFEGLPLRLALDRVDRIDTTGGPRTLIVDYKTGKLPRASSWFDEAVSQPQLPLYATPEAAVASGLEQVDGIAFAHVHGRDPALLAATNWAVQLVEGGPKGIKDPTSFDAQLAAAHERLRLVARAFLVGDLSVDRKAARDHALADLLPEAS